MPSWEVVANGPCELESEHQVVQSCGPFLGWTKLFSGPRSEQSGIQYTEYRIGICRQPPPSLAPSERSHLGKSRCLGQGDDPWRPSRPTAIIHIRLRLYPKEGTRLIILFSIADGRQEVKAFPTNYTQCTVARTVNPMSAPMSRQVIMEYFRVGPMRVCKLRVESAERSSSECCSAAVGGVASENGTVEDGVCMPQ